MENYSLLTDSYQTVPEEREHQKTLRQAGRGASAREGEGKGKGKGRGKGEKGGDGRTRSPPKLHDRLYKDTGARRADPTSL